MVVQPENDQPLLRGWSQAPPGEVAQLGRKLRARRSRRLFLKSAAATAAGVLLATSGAGLWWLFGRHREYDYGGITCSEAIRLARPYMMGQLPAADRERVRQHVAQCSVCGPRFRQMGSTNATSSRLRCAASGAREQDGSIRAVL